jgi:hypothetical protein
MSEPKSKHSLTVHFRGICTHFHHNVLPGVPHRVVLVDATSFRSGVATTGAPDSSKLAQYLVQPHLPTVHMTNDVFPDVHDLIKGGLLLSSVHLTVPNAVRQGVSYSENFERAVPSVTSFTEHYTYSADVVLAGRAAAYLDIHSGAISATEEVGQEMHLSATIPTDGPPILRVAALAEYRGDHLPALSHDFTFRESHPAMTLANACWTGQEEETNDYLLHLLTERAGIPRNVRRPKYEVVPQSSAGAAEQVRVLLEDLGYPLSFNAGMGPPGTQESCSDARYP